MSSDSLESIPNSLNAQAFDFHEANRLAEEKELGLRGWLSGGKPKKETNEGPEKDVPLDRHRLAVLPFANMSPDPSDEYFSDGMTEEMISTISKIGDLKVIARTSVMSYKGGQKKIADIAKELEVGTILEGSVRKAGNRLRITVQLIDSQASDHLWAENYDRELRDVFAIQSEVAQRVAEALKVKLFSPERKGVERGPTDNPEAYSLYLEGRYQFRKFTEDGLNKSEVLYQKALAADPKFALAYQGLAFTYANYGFLALLPEKEAYPKARGFAERALELNESLAECHYILGRILLEYYWAFSTGEAEFRRSIELNPSNATARFAYSWLLASRLESEQASAEAEKAVQLDPKSSEAWWSGCYTYYLLGDFEKGIEFGRKSIEVNPLDPFSHHILSFSYLFSGRLEEAIREMREAVALANNHVMHRANLAFVYGFAGKREDALRILDEMKETAKKEYVAPMLFAWAYAGLEDPDDFFAWLQRASEERSSFLIYTINDPFTVKTGLRNDPRFRAIMDKIGLDTSHLQQNDTP